MKAHFHLRSLDQTRAFAAHLASLLQKGDVVALYGDLGAGKTTFARALIRSLTSQDENVPSPTFTLVQTYNTPKGEIWHFDLYRLKSPDEIWELGFEDAITQGICLIEWPQRLEGIPLRNLLKIHLSCHAQEEERHMELTADTSWASRFDTLIQWEGAP